MLYGFLAEITRILGVKLCQSWVIYGSKSPARHLAVLWHIQAIEARLPNPMDQMLRPLIRLFVMHFS